MRLEFDLVGEEDLLPLRTRSDEMVGSPPLRGPVVSLTSARARAHGVPMDRMRRSMELKRNGIKNNKNSVCRHRGEDSRAGEGESVGPYVRAPPTTSEYSAATCGCSILRYGTLEMLHSLQQTTVARAAGRITYSIGSRFQRTIV